VTFAKLMRLGLVLCCLGAAYPAQSSEDEAWLYGKWELSYDPDGAKKDYLEFLANGDAWSIGPNGKVQGIYIVDGDSVKAVFTWKGKDFIMNFHADKQKQQLRIVTSRSGKASIYTKMAKP
jgi:hypothetical protein